MPSFRYTAMTSAGAVISGVINGASPRAVTEQLQNLGHYPISTVAAGDRGWRGWLSRGLKATQRASQRDLAIATHELATLLQAGLPLDRALEMLCGLSQLRRLRPQISAVLAHVRDGSTLADALEADGKTFPRLYTGLVRAGELGGSLEATLYRLADYLTKTQTFRETLKSAMVYPAILLTTAGLAIAVILIFVLPEFAPLFESAGASLPMSTRLVAGIGSLIASYWWLILLLLAGAIAGVKRVLQRPSMRQRWDTFVLRLPLVGSLCMKIETERFARTLGTLLKDGIPLPSALALTKNTLGNAMVAKAVGDTAITLREGAPLAELLEKTGVFPNVALDLVRVGEETGRLEEMLLRQADICEREVKHTIERFLTLLVPAITVFLGFVVAGLIASLFAAILSINDLALR